MDPNAFLASLQQNGTQFTPAQLQQIQLFQQQQQQNQQQQVAPQNVDTLNTNNEQSVQNISNITNNNSTQNNPTSDMNGATTFQVPTQAGTHQVTNAPPVPVNSTTNSYATNNAFQMALLGATPLQQQLAALSGYSQPQPNTTQASNDNNTMQKQQGTGTDNGQAQQQQQQIQSWNPQMLQQQFNGVNPFMATQGLVVPTAMNVQQLQQQFLTQQFLTQQLAAAGHNPTTSGNFNILASLLAQSGAASAMNPAAAGIPNQMFQPPAMSGFPFVTAPVPPQQHLMTTTTNNQVNHINVKGSNDGMKVGGEVEWTKPFAAKVKKESPFPLKLYQILGNPECQECITWNPHGRSWRILKPPVFEQVVIPLYFRFVSFVVLFEVWHINKTQSFLLDLCILLTGMQNTHRL
jgi:HSF-type DNA-binding